MLLSLKKVNYVMRKFHDTPINDISLRKFEKPSSNDVDELLRKFCISVGLLQPGDSRDLIVDLLKLFMKASRVRRHLPVEDIYKYALNFGKHGASQSNVRRHLLRLKEMNFIEKTREGYRLREWLPLKSLFEDFIKFKAKPTIERITDYALLIDQLFEKP